MATPPVRPDVQIAAALRGLLALIEDGSLVRNITNDGHFPSYLKEAARLVTTISDAQQALALADAMNDLPYFHSHGPSDGPGLACPDMIYRAALRANQE